MNLDSQRQVFTVSEVTRDLKNLLEDNFPHIWIQGEVSNFKLAASGHAYFTLKDDNAQMAAVMFRSAHQRLRFELQDGLEIILHGRVTVYEVRGQYQMIADLAEPLGHGALQLAFEQLKAKLEKEGLFAPEHKQALPFLPQKIGLVTSIKGAAVHDMMSILRRRYPNIQILIHPTKVQGPGAAEEIAAAIHTMNARTDLDLLIVGRGGGSLEDLWAFNEEVVVRAIFASRLPVISAVGHETDFSLSDFVADLRAPTPSAAAELAVPEKEDLVYQLQQNRSSLYYSLRQNLSRLRERIYAIKRQVKHPRSFLEDQRLRLDDLESRLIRSYQYYSNQQKSQLREFKLRLKSPEHLIQQQQYGLKLKTEKLKELIQMQLRPLRKKLERYQLQYPSGKWILDQFRSQLVPLESRIKAASPLDVLERGYSLAFKSGEKIPLKSADQLKEGDVLEVRLADGVVKAKVVS